MKITFLGTSHGVPSDTRFCSATLVELGDRAYLIDAGAPVAALLLRHDVAFERLKAVFTTHIHSDHTAGLVELCSLANWHYKEAAFDVYLTEEAGVQALSQFVLATDIVPLDEERVRLKLAAPGVFYDDGVLKVTAFPTRHMEYVGHPSFAYLLEAEGKRALFSGDLHGNDAADFPGEQAGPLDLIVCEMAHFGPEAIFPQLEQCSVKQVLFNHVCHGYEESMAAIRAADGRYPFSVWAVEDGDVVALE